MPSRGGCGEQGRGTQDSGIRDEASGQNVDAVGVRSGPGTHRSPTPRNGTIQARKPDGRHIGRASRQLPVPPHEPPPMLRWTRSCLPLNLPRILGRAWREYKGHRAYAPGTTATTTLSPPLGVRRHREQQEPAPAHPASPPAEFRAAVIVGSGSISFEMIRYLVERCQ